MSFFLEAIFLDMDGTLVDSERLWKIAERDWVSQKGFVLEPHLQDQFTGITVDNMIKLAKAHFGWMEDTHVLSRELNDFVKSYLRNVNEQPGATELISFAHQNNIPFALVSNSKLDIIEATLSNQPWQHLLEKRFSVDHVTHGKPAPDIYLLAAQTLGVNPKECTVIEDSVTGITAAIAANMRCIAVCHEAKDRVKFEALTPEVGSSLYEVIEILKKDGF